MHSISDFFSAKVTKNSRREAREKSYPSLQQKSCTTCKGSTQTGKERKVSWLPNLCTDQRITSQRMLFICGSGHELLCWYNHKNNRKTCITQYMWSDRFACIKSGDTRCVVPLLDFGYYPCKLDFLPLIIWIVWCWWFHMKVSHLVWLYFRFSENPA